MTAVSDRDPPMAAAPIWRQPNGQPVSCAEKIKVLNENIAEIRQMCQDAFEDALLMGCDERQIREVLAAAVDKLVNPFAATGAAWPGDTDDGGNQDAGDDLRTDETEARSAP